MDQVLADTKRKKTSDAMRRTSETKKFTKPIVKRGKRQTRDSWWRGC